MNRIALDVGEKRIGVCLNIQGITIPQSFIKTDEINVRILSLVEDNNIHEIIVGLPLNRNGEETKMSKWIRNFVNDNIKIKNIKIVYQNEFLTSIEAERKIKNDIGKKNYKEKVDSISACIILENYLDEK